MRTHIVGLLHERPEWREQLSPFEMQASVIVGDWSNLSEVLAVAGNNAQPEILFGSVVHAMLSGQSGELTNALGIAREHLGSDIAAAGKGSYRRVYESVIQLHMLHELEIIHRQQAFDNGAESSGFDATLASRLNALSPSYRVREFVLNMRRTALSIS